MSYPVPPEPYPRKKTRKLYISIPVPKELQGCTFNGKTYGPQIPESTGKEDLSDAQLIAVQRAYYWAELFIRQKQELGLLLSPTEQDFILSRAPLSTTEYLFQEAKPEHEAAFFDNAEKTALRMHTGQKTVASGSTDNDDLCGGPTDEELEQRRREAPPRPPRPIAAIHSQDGSHLAPRLPQRPSAGPKLKDVVDKFLSTYDKAAYASMYKLHTQVLPIFLDVVGNKPIADMRQKDIIEFFEILNRLPTNARLKAKKLNCSLRALAAKDLEPKLAPNTFNGTYLASVTYFFKYARRVWQDEGWRMNLTTEQTPYTAGRMVDEKQQRAFTESELNTLIQHIIPFASTSAHQYLLPLVGLFTGARINELCQLNPQVDIRLSAKGTWYFDITDESPGDPRIDKIVKTTGSKRLVPVHTKLVELGFIDYVDVIKKQGAMLLFPQWEPQQRRAAPQASEWFREFLDEIGIRDETPGECLVGAHAFRHTLMSLGYNQEPELDMTPITGHAGPASAVVRKYQGVKGIENKKRLLEALVYPVDLSQLPKLQF